MIYEVSISVQNDGFLDYQTLQIECLTLEELFGKVKSACSFTNGIIESIKINQRAVKKRFKGVEEK